jgi:hypothetical protein
LLFNYIDVDKNIKIWCSPIPTFSLKASPDLVLHFFHVRDREFRIAYLANSIMEYVVRCEFCEKSFGRYFKTHKIDEYIENVKQKMIGVFTKRREFYVEVVRCNEQESLQDALINILANFEKVVNGVVDANKVKKLT